MSTADDLPADSGPPPFDEAAIRATVARYQREYDRYLELCARVAEICRLEIVELLPRLARFLAPDGAGTGPRDSRVRRLAGDYLTFRRIADTLPAAQPDA